MKNTTEIMIQNIKNLIVLLLVLFVIGLCGRIYFFFDLLNHFRPILFFLVLSLACYIFIKKQWFTSIIYFVVALVLNYTTTPAIPSYDADGVDSNLKILHFNLLITNDNHPEVLEVISEQKPDIISFQEATQAWTHILKEELSWERNTSGGTQ